MIEPNLQPPSKKLEKTQFIDKGSKTLLFILLGIIVCLILIIFFLLLPSLQEHNKFQVKKNSNEKIELEINHQSNKSVNDEKDFKAYKTDDKEKGFNENIKINWMLKKTDAEKNKLSIWSNKDYELALDMAAKGEHYKIKKQTELAENAYTKAIKTIDEALKLKQKKMYDLITLANQSLEKENLIEAKNLLIKAQAINPQQEEIIKTLLLIEHRDEVNQLYQQAMENEKNNQLDSAILKLEKARNIEPGYKKIEEKLKILQENKRNIKFHNTISEILTALEKYELKDAQKKLKIAKALSPGDPIINELEIRISEKNKNIAIKRLLKKGRLQEKNEKWHDALTSYRKIKRYDPDASNAIINEQRVLLYIKFKKILDNILLNPDRLQNNNVFNSSKMTLDYIESEFKKKNSLLYPLKNTPDMEKNIIAAKKTLNEASKEISITIKSDNETDIVIYKIGKFGKLKQKTLLLKPGNYTIVGTRTGYRDFRKKIKIKSTDQPAIINVLCREKI